MSNNKKTHTLLPLPFPQLTQVHNTYSYLNCAESKLERENCFFLFFIFIFFLCTSNVRIFIYGLVPIKLQTLLSLFIFTTTPFPHFPCFLANSSPLLFSFITHSHSSLLHPCLQI
ncbi:hypothetical protein RIF29_20974 [Crotalaria pallida]|uniref:Uncharacterized protein n=1 Tax=Crotalaria pallida TaxID=3830 RepID=A0AAN9FAN2_CROPI